MAVNSGIPPQSFVRQDVAFEVLQALHLHYLLWAYSVQQTKLLGHTIATTHLSTTYRRIHTHSYN